MILDRLLKSLWGNEMSFFSDVGHAFSDAWHGITGGFEAAVHGAQTVINKTPLKGVFAPINFAADVVQGKNVADSLGKRSFQSISSMTWGADAAITAADKTKAGKAVFGATDKVTGGLVGREVSNAELRNQVAWGGPDPTKEQATQFAKSTAIDTAEVGAAIFTAGAASGAVAGVGAGSTAASGAGIFAGLKAGSLVGSGLSTGNLSSLVDAAGAASGLGDIAGSDAAGLVNDIFGPDAKGPQPAKTFAPVPLPYPTDTSSILSSVPSGDISTQVITGSLAAAALFLLMKKRRAAA